MKLLKFSLVPNIFVSPETLQSITECTLLRQMAKLSLSDFTLPGPRKGAGGEEENCTACLHMSNLKYCKEPGTKECFSMYPVYPQIITCATMKNC